MATREPIEDQSHEAGDESYTNKFIDSNDNDQHQDNSNDEHEVKLDQQMKIDPHLKRADRNGQSTQNASAFMESNDTATPSTSATSESANNSPITTPKSHHEEQSFDRQDIATSQHIKQGSALEPEAAAEIDHQKCDAGGADDDEELEEGELKDDDDDSDDDIPADNNSNNNRFSSFNNDNNDDNNNSGLTKEVSYGDQRLQHESPNNFSNFSARGGGQGPAFRNHPHRRQMSPINQHQQHPGMHPQYPPNHQFGNNINDDPYRFQPNHDGSIGPPMPGMPPHMVHHPMAGPPGAYPRGGPSGVGPIQKVNVRCRFYSRTSNKCTWGDHCRFEHRDDSPGPNDVFDDRMPPGPGMGPGPMRGPAQPPMVGAERPYPPFAGRHQPYPLPPHPYGYGPYEQPPYGPHHSASPPLPHHPMPHHWRQQHNPYPSPSSSSHPPESASPPHEPAGPLAPSALGGKPPNGGGPVPPTPSAGASPGYSSPSSSAVYERKHRLAYEMAPWNDRGYPPPSKYDRDPAGYPAPGSRGGYYRNHYSRDPYGREPPPPHMGGPPHPYSSSSGYPPGYPSAYRGSPMGPHGSHHRYMMSSQRAMAPDARRSRSNKRGHDEDESSWSDSGSEDSILGQASSSNRNSANKVSKKHHQRIAQVETDESSPKGHVDQGGSGTPPGEPLPEDRERQEMLLNKLKEIEDLMAKKKGEQEDPM